jgi:hypothetical protein
MSRVFFAFELPEALVIRLQAIDFYSKFIVSHKAIMLSPRAIEAGAGALYYARLQLTTET